MQIECNQNSTRSVFAPWRFEESNANFCFITIQPWFVFEQIVPGFVNCASCFYYLVWRNHPRMFRVWLERDLQDWDMKSAQVGGQPPSSRHLKIIKTFKFAFSSWHYFMFLFHTWWAVLGLYFSCSRLVSCHIHPSWNWLKN